MAGVAAATLLGLTFVLDYLVYRFRWLERVVEGSPQILIEDGRVSERALKRERLTEQQLLEALRREKVASPEQVARAYIEADGRITVIPKKAGGD